MEHDDLIDLRQRLASIQHLLRDLWGQANGGAPAWQDLFGRAITPPAPSTSGSTSTSTSAPVTSPPTPPPFVPPVVVAPPLLGAAAAGLFPSPAPAVSASMPAPAAFPRMELPERAGAAPAAMPPFLPGLTAAAPMPTTGRLPGAPEPDGLFNIKQDEAPLHRLFRPMLAALGSHPSTRNAAHNIGFALSGFPGLGTSAFRAEKPDLNPPAEGNQNNIQERLLEGIRELVDQMKRLTDELRRSKHGGAETVETRAGADISGGPPEPPAYAAHASPSPSDAFMSAFLRGRR